MTYPLAPYATISKEFAFSASHQLTGLPSEHPCSRLHGHNYKVIVQIEGRVVEPGFVVDYRELDDIKQFLDTQWDHRHLNDMVGFNPTAEHMASFLADRIAGDLSSRENITYVEVSVSETPKTLATVRRVASQERNL